MRKKAAIMGWGVLDQLAGGRTRHWDQHNLLMNAAVQAFFDAGLTWVGLPVSLGMLRMDADYWTPYLNIGLPQPRGATPEGTAWGQHNADPVINGQFSYLTAWLNWRLAFIDALNVEAARRGVTLKVWVKMHDNPNTSLPWYYDTSTSPARYGDGVVALWQWLAANKGWVPDAIEVMNDWHRWQCVVFH
jgi:hypothetical protein